MLTEYLSMTKVRTKYDESPHKMGTIQKRERVEWCEKCLERYQDGEFYRQWNSGSLL